MQPLKIEIDPQSGGSIFSGEFSGTIEVGRQRESEPDAPNLIEGKSGSRLIVAALTEVGISRSHLQIDQLEGGKIRITNLTRHGPLQLVNGSVDCGQACELALPAIIPLGRHFIRVDTAAETPVNTLMQSLPLSTFPPRDNGDSQPEMSVADLQRSEVIPPARILKWMHQILSLFKEVAGTEKFYRTALTGLQQMLNLTSAAILFHENDSWQIEHVVFSGDQPANSNWQPSMTILESVEKEKRAFRQVPTDQVLAKSLSEVTSLVAAPLFDDQRNVIGAVYGDRRTSAAQGAMDITELEALFVELIASGIATGLARIENEKSSAAARTRFEQFFPPTLARRLEADDNLLEGRESDVSILFCDIRKFSEISERIGPRETVRLINSVMFTLSQCVMNHSGVLVDYIGDELFAMWGAPDDQPDHAVLACQAALSMLDALPKLSDEWRESIGGELAVGIGINSGRAQVGNIGSSVKFKYGPLGNCVNVASRIQNATKQLQTTAMISESTARLVGERLSLRRLCRIRVVNVNEAFTVFELSADQSSEYVDSTDLYEKGLTAFEAGENLVACKHLTDLLARFPDDGPALILLSRAVNRLGEENAQSDCVWNLDRK